MGPRIPLFVLHGQFFGVSSAIPLSYGSLFRWVFELAIGVAIASWDYLANVSYLARWISHCFQIALHVASIEFKFTPNFRDEKVRTDSVLSEKPKSQ